MTQETYDQQTKDSDQIFKAISSGSFDNFKQAEQAVVMLYAKDMSYSRSGISHALKRLERFYATKDKGIGELDGVSKEVLAQWWCQLNNHGWPEALGEPEPRDAPEPRRRTILMDKIMETIGFKECLREWNKETLPGEAFDNWFATTKLSD